MSFSQRRQLSTKNSVEESKFQEPIPSPVEPDFGEDKKREEESDNLNEELNAAEQLPISKPGSKSPIDDFGYLLVPELLNDFENRFQILVGNKVHRDNRNSIFISFDGLPFCVKSPWLTTTFEMSEFVHKTSTGGKYFKYSVCCTLPSEIEEDGKRDLTEEEIYFLMLRKMDAIILKWGSRNPSLLYSKEEMMEMKKKYETMSIKYQPLIRPQKGKYNPTTKISIPVSTKQVMMQNGIYECTMDGNTVELTDFSPQDLKEIRKGSEIKTYVTPIELWANNKSWGTTQQARHQLAIRFPPPKKCNLV